MQKFIVVIGFLLFGLHTYAQESTSTLSITGKAAVYQLPELISISLNLSAEDPEYNACVKKAMDKMEGLKKDFEALNVKPEDVKVEGFNINEHFDWDNGKRVNKGYQARMNLSVEAAYSKKFMTKLLKLLSENATDVNYQFAFKLSEEQKASAKEELIKKAVADAKTSANYMAEAAGLTLKNIKSMQLGQQQDYQPIQYRDMMVAESMVADKQAGNFNFDFVPKEIPLYQTVQILWVVE